MVFLQKLSILSSRGIIFYFLAIPVLFSCKAPNPDELKKDLLPEITEAYKAGNWSKVISLTDSLRNSGVPYTDYIGDKGFDMSYCEALIATGTPDLPTLRTEF